MTRTISFAKYPVCSHLLIIRKIFVKFTKKSYFYVPISFASQFDCSKVLKLKK